MERAQPRAEQIHLHVRQGDGYLPPDGIEYWARLAAVIDNNPIEERDRFFMAMLRPLGIEKGKPFQPDERQRAILEDAAGRACDGRNLLFNVERRISDSSPFPGTHWHFVLLMDADQETDTYSQLDERLHYFYGAIYMSPAIGVMKAGPGRSTSGLQRQGWQSLRRRQVVSPAYPANVPVSAFWSLTLYDTATRSMIQNPEPLCALRQRQSKVNADGSVDLYFGPKRPARARKATGSKRCPARASIRSSGSMAPLKPCSTERGRCRTSNW